MLQRLTFPGIELPRLYIAQNKNDAIAAVNNGIPFICWKGSNDSLVKYLLRPVLEQKFPGIKWDKVLGKKKKIESKVIVPEYEDSSGNFTDYDLDQQREKPEEIEFDPGVYDEGHGVDDTAYVATAYGPIGTSPHKGSSKTISIQDYLGDLSSSVNIEVLQNLNLLPSFIGDIVDCIKKNNQSVLWTEGYNKKLRQAVGNFNRGRECRNLIILDVSISIPRGIASTMLSLIDTLRYQVSADLLITGGDSGFYKHGEDLPDIDTLYKMYGGCNETERFLTIMEKNVVGKEWGHVIAFGDCNEPNLKLSWFSWAGTKVHEVHHYHTKRKTEVGYATWVHLIDKKPDKVDYNTKWCNVIEKD